MKIESLSVVMRVLTCLTLLVTLLLTNFTFLTVAYAQEESASPVTLGFCREIVQVGAVSDETNSVDTPQLGAQISLGEKDYFLAGETIPFSVTVSNPFSYDIVGAELLLALVYTPGSEVVDYVSYPESLTIPANDSVIVTVPMDVPTAITSGGYTAVAYIGQSGQDILLSNALAKVEGQESQLFMLYGNDSENDEIIRIMHGGGVLVAGESVIDEMIRKVPSDSEQATVRVTIQNTYKAPVSATLTWKVYAGLTPHPAMLVDTTVKELAFEPSAASLIETLDVDLVYDQYSVVAELVFENSRQVVFIPFEKEEITVMNAIPPFLQLTHFGLNESGTLVGCIGSRSVADSAVETVSEHLPIPFEVELAFYADEQTMINGGSPVTVVKAADTAADLFSDDVSFSYSIDHTQAQYYVQATVRQFGEDVSSNQFALSCVGIGCQQTDSVSPSSGNMFSNIQYGIVIAAMILFFVIIYTLYGYRKPEDQG